METWKIGGWILLYLTLCCLFCNLVSAQSLVVTDMLVSPAEIWLNKNPNMVTISAKCEFGGSIANNAEMWAQISFPKSGSMSTVPLITGIYEYQLYASFPDTGAYTVRVNCEYNGQSTSATRTFTAHRLDLSMDYVKEIDTYLGDDLSINVKFKLDGSYITPKKDTFEIYLGVDDRWERLEQTEDPILSGDYQQVKVKIPLYSDRIRKGLYDLRIEGILDDELLMLVRRKFVWVNDPLEVYMKEDDIVHVVGSSASINLSARVVFKAGDLWDLGVENAEIVIYDQDTSKKVSVKSLYCDRIAEECVFSFDVPSIAPGSYDLALTVAYPSIVSYRYKSTASIPLNEVLSLSGEVMDAKGKVVPTTIVVESVDIGEIEEIKTSSNGSYSLGLLPGRYNFIFRFSDGNVVRVSNVSISNLDLISLPGNIIRYDQGHIGSNVPEGMRMLKIVVLELVFPFSDVWVHMPYDSSKVTGDERKLQVYTCERWNFERSVCTGSWDLVDDVVVRTIKDVVEFNATSYGAFMLGENDKLSFSDSEVLDSEVYMGDQVILEGTVVNSKGEPVYGATINASFPGYANYGTTKTSDEGEFRVSLSAPNFEGNVEILLEAGKDLFIGTNATHLISIGRKKEIGILKVPDIVDVSLDEVTDIEFSLFNSGQINLDDTIYLHVIGISSDWYELLPNYVDGLKVNEEKPFILRIKLTHELCGGKCNKFYLVNLEATSDEISKVASFTIKVPTIQVNETESIEEEQEEESPQGVGITGFTVSMPSISSPYLFLTAIFILSFLIVNKKKTQKSGTSFRKHGKRGHVLRDSIMSSFHRIRKEP